MKVIILKQPTTIDGKAYRQGEVIVVDDNFNQDLVKEVIKELTDKPPAPPAPIVNEEPVDPPKEVVDGEPK